MGSPTAVQLKVTFCPTYVMMFCGGAVITGTTRMKEEDGKERVGGERVARKKKIRLSWMPLYETKLSCLHHNTSRTY